MNGMSYLATSCLAEKRDKYENVRGNVSKMENKMWNNKPYSRVGMNRKVLETELSRLLS